MGFKMKSESGKDMSFVMYINDTDDGKEGRIRCDGSQKIAHGEFCNPEDADILVTLPAEAFVRIYTGEVSVAAVTSLVLRGKVGVCISTRISYC